MQVRTNADTGAGSTQPKSLVRACSRTRPGDPDWTNPKHPLITAAGR